MIESFILYNYCFIHKIIWKNVSFKLIHCYNNIICALTKHISTLDFISAVMNYSGSVIFS